MSVIRICKSYGPNELKIFRWMNYHIQINKMKRWNDYALKPCEWNWRDIWKNSYMSTWIKINKSADPTSFSRMVTTHFTSPSLMMIWVFLFLITLSDNEGVRSGVVVMLAVVVMALGAGEELGMAVAVGLAVLVGVVVVVVGLSDWVVVVVVVVVVALLLLPSCDNICCCIWNGKVFINSWQQWNSTKTV